nr:MAG TPA: hypothetical protein [Caudoviricetes sp.]
MNIQMLISARCGDGFLYQETLAFIREAAYLVL